MDVKRKDPPSPEVSGALVKKSRGSTPLSTEIAISSGNDQNKSLIRSIQRTSGLEAPIISLTGAHSAEILSCRFDPTGQNIAACSSDRSVSLWRTYPPNSNYGHIQHIHKAAILDLQWSLTSPNLYTASADKTVGVSDLTTGQRVRRIRAHGGVINSIDRIVTGGTELLASGADDGLVKIWTGETKTSVDTWEVGIPITTVCWSPDGAQIYAGALDNVIHVYDIRKREEVMVLRGHTESPSSLSFSPSGNHLLSPSFSSNTIIWDVRPFAPNFNRIHRVLQGAPAGFEQLLSRCAWSRDDGGKRAAVGGADRMVTIWDVESGRILYKLPGHKGTVTAIDFHPKEPIVLSASTDGTMLLGEIARSS